MSDFTQSQIKKITSIALEAGEIATRYFTNKNFEIWKKPDNSILTSADLEISRFFNTKLTKNFPHIPIICEEGELRKVEKESFWLIDPIDGTSSFASDHDEFAICVALIKKQKATFGLIYAPIFEGGKMIFTDHKNRIISQNLNHKKRILEIPNPDKSKLRIITSLRSKDSDIKNYLIKMQPNFLPNFIVEKRASAIKFFRLLEGEANLYLHFRKSMEWDTAAGQALVEAMNGKVKNLFFNQDEIKIGENLTYQKPGFLNPAFVASI